MAYINKRGQYDSRRQVQRRFPPGAFLYAGGALCVVVGWVPVAPKALAFSGGRMSAATWEALLLINERMQTMRWENVRECWTLEEWEAQ